MRETLGRKLVERMDAGGRHSSSAIETVTFGGRIKTTLDTLGTCSTGSTRLGLDTVSIACFETLPPTFCPLSSRSRHTPSLLNAEDPCKQGLSHESGVLAFCGGFDDHARMVNVRCVDRDQLLLMPPSLSDWLPTGHLAWLIVDVVAELDLSGFYRSLRADGRGGAAYDPQVMLGVSCMHIARENALAAVSSNVFVTMWRFG